MWNIQTKIGVSLAYKKNLGNYELRDLKKVRTQKKVLKVDLTIKRVQVNNKLHKQ